MNNTDAESNRITQEWHPSYWVKDTHGSAWEKVAAALQRDWEQTKADFHLGGTDLKQNVTDTVKQATGKEPIPPANTPNWDDAEQPLMYGVGARTQYGDKHAQWNDHLETTLKNDWEGASGAAGRKWNDVKGLVRHGYDRARS